MRTRPAAIPARRTAAKVPSSAAPAFDGASEWIGADLAAALLGVTKPTLYAYVSRGKLAAAPGATPQSRLYRRSEIERLAALRGRGRRPREVARGALDWGLPVLESGLTLIDAQRLFYRGRPALELAETQRLEDVACVLWSCRWEEAFDAAAPRASASRFGATFAALPVTERLPVAFALLQAGVGTFDELADARHRVRHAGALLRLACAAALGTPPATAPIHAQFAAAWGLARPGADAVRAALVLSADHELNASSFVARCVASTGAGLGQAVTGGLVALSGGHHGGMTARVEALWDELERAATPRAGLQARLVRGEVLPGFGHPLYPSGDPRSAAILARLPAGPVRRTARRLATQAEALTGHRPQLDFALVALRRALGAPPGGAYALFAVGRTVGWIAHALEQYATGTLIRPRAAYVGPKPVTSESAGDAPRGPASVFER